MDFNELMAKNPKTQSDAMLCQAIAALSTQPQFEKMTPWEVFEHVQNTCQHWLDMEIPLHREFDPVI